MRKFSRLSHTPAYVDRETGAAELCIDPLVWDRWVKEGRLPPPARGFPASVERWRWADVDARLPGNTESARQAPRDPETEEPIYDLYAPRPRGRRKRKKLTDKEMEAAFLEGAKKFRSLQKRKGRTSPPEDTS
jgi:hypothetical protein